MWSGVRIYIYEKLQGLEDNVTLCNKGDSFIVVRLECLEYVKMKIENENVETIQSTTKSSKITQRENNNFKF